MAEKIKAEKITDQQTYLNRRHFMRIAALAGTATATTLLYRRLNPPPPELVQTEKIDQIVTMVRAGSGAERLHGERDVDAVGSDHQLQQLLRV